MHNKQFGVLIYIRYRQIIRAFHKLGAMALFIVALFVGAISYSFYAFQNIKGAIAVATVLAVICISIQQSRKDKKFLQFHVANSYIAVFFEYLILIFSFAIWSIVTPYWYLFPLLVALVAVVPLIRNTPKNRTYFKRLSNITGAKNFEITSGFRKYFLLLIPLYLAGLGFSWLKVFPLFILWLLTTVILGFYMECEPIQLLKAQSNSPKKLLNNKLIRHGRIVLFAYLPIIIINTIFNPNYWLLNLLFIPMQLCILSCIICSKYSSYQPKIVLTGHSIILMLLSAGALVPFLLPLPL